MSTSVNAFELDHTYVQLHDGATAKTIPVDPDFWDRIQERKELHEGCVVIVSHQSGAMMHWEVHAAGDELVYLLSGNIDVVLEIEDRELVVSLRERTALIVPCGVWHTLRIRTPGDLLSIMRGAGTQVRPVSETR